MRRFAAIGQAMATADSRVGRRAAERSALIMGGRRWVIGVVAVVVLANIGASFLGLYLYLTRDWDTLRALSPIATGIGAMLNLLFLVLVWLLFEQMDRTAREADRLQAFMDNVYRRGP